MDRNQFYHLFTEMISRTLLPNTLSISGLATFQGGELYGMFESCNIYLYIYVNYNYISDATDLLFVISPLELSPSSHLE